MQRGDKLKRHTKVGLKEVVVMLVIESEAIIFSFKK